MITNKLRLLILLLVAITSTNASAFSPCNADSLQTGTINRRSVKKYGGHGAGISKEEWLVYGHIKLTHLEQAIREGRIRQDVFSKEFFEYDFIRNNIYDLFILTIPYDTTVVIIKYFDKVRQRAEEIAEGSRADRSFKIRMGYWLKAGAYVMKKRKDFLAEICNVYKTYLPEDLYFDAERAVYELHDSLGLSLEDSIPIKHDFVEIFNNRCLNDKDILGTALKRIWAERQQPSEKK